MTRTDDVTEQRSDGAGTDGHGRSGSLRTIGVCLLVFAVLFASAPVAAVGQTAGDGAAPDSRVLLDGERTDLGTVTVDGETYRVYRYDNALPYAGGVEVYVDGRRVTDPAAARPGLARVAAERALVDEGIENAPALAERAIAENGEPGPAFQRVAWQGAVRELDPGDIETLREIRSTAAEIDGTLSPAVRGLDSTLGFIDGLKERSILGQSAWDMATTAAPGLETFEETARALREGLGNWQQAARSVDENVRPVIESLERMERGESVDYDELSTRFQRAMTALDDLQAQSDRLESRLSDAASTSSSIASSVGGVPVVGGGIADQFDGLSDRLRTAASDVGSFSDTLQSQRSSLQSVQSSADSTRSSLRSTYESELASLEGAVSARNSAQLKVYGTGGVAVALGGLGLWRLLT